MASGHLIYFKIENNIRFDYVKKINNNYRGQNGKQI